MNRTKDKIEQSGNVVIAVSRRKIEFGLVNPTTK